MCVVVQRLLLLLLVVAVSRNDAFHSVRSLAQQRRQRLEPSLQIATNAVTVGTQFARIRKRDILKQKVKDMATLLAEKAQKMEKGWNNRASNGSFRRTFELWIFAITFYFKWSKANRLKKKNDEVAFAVAQSQLAILLRDKLLDLGPAFIKLGQLLSTRIDVIPKAYIEALEVLQDQVPGFSGEEATKIIESELGKPIGQLFDTFDPKPLAAASLGQVHVATRGSQKFAVKVQRPGLKALFDMDLKNIRVLSILLDKADPKTDGAQRDWVSIFEESAKLLYREIDYKLEAFNCIRFRENFADVPWVKVPFVDLASTTQRVITMEYVPGIKINDLAKIDEAKIDRVLLSQRSAEAYLTQLCRHGFFHCDPHPGNVACDAELGGRLIFYDFGMMDELKPGVRSGLVNLIFSVFDNEPRECCNALEEMGVLRKGVDRVSIERVARIFLNDFKRGVKKGEKWVNQLSKDEQKKIRNQRRAQLGSDLFSVGNDLPFRFPPTFTFVFRAFTSLDGIGKGLNTDYDLTRLAQPFLKELVDLRDGDAFVSFLKTWGKKLGWRPIDIANTVQFPRKIALMADILTRIEQGDLKPRARVLESEQSFKGLEIIQQNVALAIVASVFLNTAIVLASLPARGTQIRVLSKLSFAVAAFFGLQLPLGFLRLKKLSNIGKAPAEAKEASA